jgi:hypothetical protein
LTQAEIDKPIEHTEIAAPYVDQMLRQTRAHHVQLSIMADIKANILLTVATLITTFAIGYLDFTVYFWPVALLMIFCIPTILCAVYAVMPKLFLGGKNKKIDPTASTFNLLFFGDFVHMEYEEYKDAMSEVLMDPERAYELMLREIHTLGIFLMKKKYRFLRLGYLFFLLGILSSGGALAYQIYSLHQGDIL